MQILEAQSDMRSGYFNGAPGVLASALAWAAAALVALYSGPQHAVLALFAGGMLIHPLGMLLAKLLGRRGAHTPGNPLGVLALEGTIQMLLCLPLAYVISRYRLEWFFPAMLLVIGGRYLTFATIYGEAWYRWCGAALALAAMLLVKLAAAPALAAFVGAGIEAVFALVFFVRERANRRS